MFFLLKWIPQHFLVLRAPDFGWGFHKTMSVSNDEVLEKLNNSLEIELARQAKQSEALSLFYGSCEKDGEPDYELLRKHIEVWTQRHAQEMAQFCAYREQVLKENFRESGATSSLNMRKLGAMPPGLYALLNILSANFLGGKELTVDKRTKKQRTFYKKFPVFSMCEKI